jgi:hypothetical protein
MLIFYVLPLLLARIFAKIYLIFCLFSSNKFSFTPKAVSGFRPLYNIPHCDIFLCMTTVIVVDQSFNSTKDLWLGGAFIFPTT